MNPNPLDDVLSKVVARQRTISDTVSRRFKRTNPFATENLPSQAKIWAIDNLGTEDMGDLIKEFGEEKVNYTLFQVNNLRQKSGE